MLFEHKQNLRNYLVNQGLSHDEARTLSNMAEFADDNGYWDELDDVEVNAWDEMVVKAKRG